VIWLTRCLVAIALVAVGAAGGGRAQAAAAYQGIYVVIDPYNLTNITQLQTAAQTTCAQNQKSITTPFCGATNGILLRAAWCNFQLYHVNGPSGKPYPGCHYTTVWPSGASSGHGLQAPDTDTTSPCPGIYDTCTGRTTSVLGKVLHSIVQINAQRSTAGLPPLLLSIGIYAGQGTPQSVFDSQGYVDVPYNYSATTQSTEQCFRLPLEWLPQFVSAYEAAQDQFVSYIKAQMPQGANIVVEKMGAISSNDLEVEMQGPAAPVSSPPDPGPAGPGPLLNCSQTVAPAQVWLNAYNANPTYNMNMSQAIESAFGGTIGHALGTLANNGIKTTLISLATTNGDAFPMVNCGVTGAAVCSVSPQSGNWSVYYMEKYVGDLFNGGLAYTQAQAAYAAIRSDTFSLAPTQISIDSTALSPTPIASASQISCNMNNVITADAPVFGLGGSQVQVIGVGTGIGWQTATLQGGLCSSNQYGQALSNGINDGGTFIEVETDAAFSNIAQCSPYLVSALNKILAVTPPTTCSY
jgi:hypothetical protein